MSREKQSLTVRVPTLARVEGEGGLDLKIKDGRIEELHFRIFEPPRLFEKLLEDREYHDAPDITARICGICPVAYQMSSSQAMEDAFGLQVTPWIEAMRRVMYCGEWIQSHALHIHLLALPDFLGYDNSLAMAEKYGSEIKRGLALQKLGNDIITLFGGRSVHPVSVTVGGFHATPDAKDVTALREKLSHSRHDAEDLLRWLVSLNIADFGIEQDFISLALSHDEEYAINRGRVRSDQGHDFDIADYEDHISETHVDWSTALHAQLEGQPFLTGPLARLNLNHGMLPTEIRSLLGELGIHFPSRRIADSILARAIELLFVIDEAARLLAHYQKPDNPSVPVSVEPGIGHGCTEAPRGLLYHRYQINESGRIANARLIPPTSQNQARIEDDLHQTLEALGLDKDADQLRQAAEGVVRHYDPCISCSVHFLKLNIEET